VDPTECSEQGKLISTPGEVVDALVEEVIAPKLLPFVRPIYLLNSHDEPWAWASAVLLRSARQMYFTTAAHVFDASELVKRDSAPSRLLIGHLSGEIFPLDPCLFQKEPDPIDLALSPIPSALSSEWDLHPALDVDTEVARQDTTGLHLLIGYAASRKFYNLDRARRTIQHDPFLYAETRHELPNNSEHFTLRMESRNIKRGDSVQWAPEPYGASGGGVFLAKDGVKLLAGIAIEYPAKHTHIRVTKSTHVHELLKRFR